MSRFAIAIVILFTFEGAWSSIACETHLFGQEVFAPATTADQWIFAIEQLGGRPELLATDQYLSWVESLAMGQIASPFDRNPVLSTEALLWDRVLSALALGGQLESSEIANRASEILSRLRGQNRTRDEVVGAVRSTILQAAFLESGLSVEEVDLPLPPGVSNRDHLRQATIEIMSTPMTQWMWARLMGSNPSQFTGTTEVVTEKKFVKVAPNHPLENVTLVSLEILLQHLNGSWASAAEVRQVVPDHQRGDIYSVPNIALANKILQRISVDFGPAFKGIFSEKSRVLPESLEDFVWYEENSSGRTQEVATLRPFKLRSQQIFDWLGNTAEWNVDSWTRNQSGLFRAHANGGSFKTSRKSIHVYSQGPGPEADNQRIGPTESRSNVGFRLIRLRKLARQN